MISSILTTLSVVALIVGAALAWGATLQPKHAALLQRMGGLSLLAGLGLIGINLQGVC